MWNHLYPKACLTQEKCDKWKRMQTQSKTWCRQAEYLFISKYPRKRLKQFRFVFDVRRLQQCLSAEPNTDRSSTVHRWSLLDLYKFWKRTFVDTVPDEIIFKNVSLFHYVIKLVIFEQRKPSNFSVYSIWGCRWLTYNNMILVLFSIQVFRRIDERCTYLFIVIESVHLMSKCSPFTRAIGVVVFRTSCDHVLFILLSVSLFCVLIRSGQQARAKGYLLSKAQSYCFSYLFMFTRSKMYQKVFIVTRWVLVLKMFRENFHFFDIYGKSRCKCELLFQQPNNCCDRMWLSSYE